MKTQIKKYVIHDGYYGFISGEKDNASLIYSVKLNEAKHFTYDEILQIEDDLYLEHPSSQIDICTLDIAKNKTFTLLNDCSQPRPLNGTEELWDIWNS